MATQMAPGGYANLGMTMAQYNAYMATEGSKPSFQQQDPTEWLRQRTQPAPSYRTDVDPQKAGGYTFATSLDSGQKEGYLNYKSQYAANMTEYEYRAKFGLDTRTVAGSYTPITYGSYGHSVNTVTPNAKLATQAKVITDKSGTRVATPSAGTSARQSVAANQIKTSATTTAARNSPAGQAAAKAQGQVSSSSSKTTSKKVAELAKQKETVKATVVKPNPATIKASTTKPTTAALTKQTTTPKTISAQTPIQRAGTGVQTKSTKELLAINSKTVVTNKATVVPKNKSALDNPSVRAQMEANAGKSAYEIMKSLPGTIDQSGTSHSANNNTHFSARVVKPISAEQARQQQEAQAQAQAARAAYNPLLNKYGQAINQIEGNGFNEYGQSVLIESPVKVNNQKTYYVRDRAQSEMDAATYNYQKELRNPLSPIGAGLRANENLKNILSKKGTPDMFVTQQQQKDIVLQKNLKDFEKQHPIVGAPLTTLYNYTKDAPSIVAGKDKLSDIIASSVTKKIMPDITSNYNEAKKAAALKNNYQARLNVSPISNFEAKRKAAFSSVGLEGARKGIESKIYSNALGKATMEVVGDAYNTVRNDPVTAALEAGKLYLEAEAGGALFGGGKMVLRGGLEGVSGLVGKGTESLITKSSTSKLVSSIGETNIRNVSGVVRGVLSSGAKMVNPIVDNTLAGSLLYQGNEMYKKGDYENLVKSAGVLALSAPGFVKGSEFAESGISTIAPKLATTAEKAKFDLTIADALGATKSTALKGAGIIRGQTIGAEPYHDLVTLRSRGDVAEKVLNNERVNIVRAGMRSGNNPMKVGSSIAGEEGAINRAVVYKKGDFGISQKITGTKERDQAIKEIKAGSKDYLVDTSADPLAGTMTNPARGFYGSVASNNGIEPYSELFVRNGGVINKNPMSTTSRAIQKTAIKAQNVLGEKSKAGKLIARVVDTENLGTSYKAKNRYVMVNENVRTVELTDRLKADIIKDLKSGRITDEHKQAMYDLAYEQSGKYKEPVAIIPPKTASGWAQSENEIFVVVHPDANTISAKKFAGYTRSGIKVSKVAVGEQKLSSSILGNIKENLDYNTSLGIDKYGIYNKKLQQSENYNMQRRINELSGKTLVKIEGGYEHGQHGQIHANAVEKNMNLISQENPHLGVTQKTAMLRGQYHDVAKIGERDNPLTSHGTTAARAIRKGEIHSPELDALTKQERIKVANDIAYHDLNKPLSSGNLLGYVKTKSIYKPSKEAKVLSNADRMDLTRFDIKVDKNQLFDVSYRRGLGERLTESSRDITEALRSSRIIRDESAEVFLTGRRAKTETKTVYASGKSLDIERTSLYSVPGKNSPYSLAAVLATTAASKLPVFNTTGKSSYNNPYPVIKGGSNAFPGVTIGNKYPKPYSNQNGGSNKFPLPYSGYKDYPYSEEKGGGKNYLPIPKPADYKQPYTPSENKYYPSYKGYTPSGGNYYPVPSGKYTPPSSGKYTPPSDYKPSKGSYNPSSYNPSSTPYSPSESPGGTSYTKKGKSTSPILPPSSGKKPNKKSDSLAAKRDLLGIEDVLTSKTKVATFAESLGRGRTQLAKNNKQIMITKPKDNAKKFYRAVTGKKR